MASHETRAASGSGSPPTFVLSAGKLTRSIGVPPEETTPEEFAERISDYVRRFDADMKAFIKQAANG